MAQHDYNIANQSGADFRADLNNALLAIATTNSGASEPSTTFAHQLWVDTSSSVLKIRNGADNAWITTGISITASNTFTGDLTGNVTGNITGNVTGNVTGDLTGNADTATTLATARTISLSGDVVGSASFDGSGDINISTTAQINSIALGTDTTGDYVQSISGGTGVTITGGTGEGSTPSVAIGQAVATTDNVTFNLITATDEFIGDIDGAIRFTAKADEALTKGDVIYITGVSGNTPTIAKAKADDASKMPAFGIALQTVNANAPLQIVTLGTIESLDTSNESVGEILYVSTTAGEYTTTIPTGETSQIQNIGKVLRSHATVGSIRVGGAGRSNATPNLDNGKIFIGNGSNQSVTSTLDTSIVVENTNLYYTTTRANTDFDSRLATKDTGDLTEGSNLYYTTARVNSDFDTRLATKDTGDLTEGSNLYYTDARVNSAFDTRLATKDTDDLTEGTTNLYYTSGRANTDFDTRLATKSTSDLAEGTNLYYTSARFDSAFTSKDTDDLSEGTTNLYYTTARFDSAFGNKTTADLTENTNLYYTDTRANSAIDARVTKAFVDALNIQAASVDANSVTLGTDTTGNYVQTITGTANKITVSGSGSESADITLTLPDDVQIADSLTVAGNLTVNGTLTSLDTTNLDIEDNLFQLNAGLTGSPVNDSGMLINRGTSDNGIFMWDESVDKFTMGLTTADGSATGNITLNSLGTLVANLEGNVTGNVTGQVSDISNFTTANLTENTNLYYTQARFDSAFGGKSTSDLSEGTNLYYTDARAQAVSINNVVEDTTPQLGGNLDLNSSDITGAGNINITGTIQSSGNITGTLATAAQPNITSVGTLTALTGGTGDLNWDSGTLFVDSSANAVGVGLTSPDFPLTVQANSGGNALKLRGRSAGGNEGWLVWTDNADNVEAGMYAISDNLIFANTTSFTERMRVTSTGVGIGTTSPSVVLDTRLSTTTGKVAEFHNNAGYGIGFTVAGDGGVNTINSESNQALAFATNGASNERVRIDASGNVGIKESSPSATLHTNSGTGNIGIHQESTDSGSYISFSDNSTTSISHVLLGAVANDLVFNAGDAERMRIDASGTVLFKSGSFPTNQDSPFIYRIGGGSLAIGAATETGTSAHAAFYTNSLERMRIDSSGNVLVGTTSTSLYNDTSGGGINLFANGGVTFAKQSTSASDPVLLLNNTGTDGQIIDFRKDGTTVGSIGTTGSNVVIGTGSVGLRFYDGGDAVIPHTAAGGSSNGLIDLGQDGFNEFKDLYLSGNAYVGTSGFLSNNSGEYIKLDNVDDTIEFSTTGSERARIDSSGNLLVNTTSVLTPSASFANLTLDGSITVGPNLGSITPSGTISVKELGGTSMSFFYGTTKVGSITNTASATAYNTSSDARLKDVTGSARGLEVINELNPVAYNWKESGQADEGLIAQEVQEIVPNAVSGSEEEMYQMDYSKLVVHLVAGMKEQQAQIEALQSEINLLKGE